MEQEIAWVKTVTEELDERGGDRVKVEANVQKTKPRVVFWVEVMWTVFGADVGSTVIE